MIAENKLGIEDFNSCEEAVVSGFTHYDGRKIVCKTAHKGQDIRNVFINPDEVHVYTFNKDEKTHAVLFTQGASKVLGTSTIPGDVEGDVWSDTLNKWTCSTMPVNEPSVFIGNATYQCQIPKESDIYFINIYTTQEVKDIYNGNF